MRNHVFLILAICWTLLITFLSLVSLKDGPKLPFSFADKIIHSIIYFVCTISWFLAFSKKQITPFLLKNALIISVLFSVFYGILMEVLQETLVENRQGDWQDALANAIGAIMAGILIKYFAISSIKLKTKN